MYKENYYTPPQAKYSSFRGQTRDERSQTFSNLQKSSAYKST